MFFTIKEMNPKGVPLTSIQESNMRTLIERMCIVRSAWGKPMKVTSGFRSIDDHKRIYREIAQKRGLETIRVPMGSRHLEGAACDISDPDGTLMDWCLANESILVEIGLWCEERDATPRVHFQIFPPKSGKRFFKP